MVGSDIDRYTARFHELARRIFKKKENAGNKRRSNDQNKNQGRDNRNKRQRTGRNFALTAPEQGQGQHQYDGQHPKLELEGYTFIIDLIPFGYGSFDVIIGMDWLSNLRAKIVCFEKIVQILLSNGDILEVHRERPEGNLKQLKIMKVNDSKLEDIPVVREFPGVFSEDLSGLPTSRKVEFRIDIILGAMLGTYDFVVYCDASNPGFGYVLMQRNKSEASKDVNTPAEMLKGLAKQFERKGDGGLYLAERIWVAVEIIVVILLPLLTFSIDTPIFGCDKKDLPKPVTPHYLPKVKEYVFVKHHHMIESGLYRNSSKESYRSNDMTYNYYLEEAKKKTHDKNMNPKPRKMPSARTYHTLNVHPLILKGKTQSLVAKNTDISKMIGSRNSNLMNTNNGVYRQHFKPRSLKKRKVTRTKPPSLTPYILPTKKEWDILFQPMFDEYFNPPPSVASPLLVVVTPEPADPTGTPSLATIDQDAPSPISTSRYVVPTGRVVAPTGRYVVPVGNFIIVSSGRLGLIPTGRVLSPEGLHKGYDRMQKILSQLNQLKAKPEDEDINLKFLRALPSSWSQMAYGDSPSYSSTTSYTAPSNSKTGSHRFGNVIKDVLQSFVANTKPEQQLAYEDFKQIEKLDLEEMDLKWQMAMLFVRVHKFEQKAGRKIAFDKKESARFNKKKVRCYKYQQRGHFNREYKAKEGNDKHRYSSFKIKEIGKKEKDSKALITVDTLVDWIDHDGESDGVIASKEFGMIAGCDTEDAVKEGAAKIYNLITGADTEEACTAGDAGEFALMGVTSEIRVLSIELENTSNLLKHSERINADVESAKKELQKKLDNHLVQTEKWRISSKNLFRLMDSSMSVRTKVGLGFNNYIWENELGWDDFAFSVFTTDSEDVEGRPLFNRFAKADSMKAVPSPLSGDYTSLSDHIDLDESQMSYGTKSSTSSDSKSMSNDFVSYDDNDKSSEVNTNDFASSDSSVKSSEPKPNDSSSCASTSIVSTFENEDVNESNVGTPIQEPIIVQDLPSFSCNSSEKIENTSRTSCNKNVVLILLRIVIFMRNKWTGKVNIPPARPQPVPVGKPKVFAPVHTGRKNRPFLVPTDRGYSPSVISACWKSTARPKPYFSRPTSSYFQTYTPYVTPLFIKKTLCHNHGVSSNHI
nr:putative reverse transcriptase domain-containing protein [Tanacetum cinerariifolium]